MENRKLKEFVCLVDDECIMDNAISLFLILNEDIGADFLPPHIVDLIKQYKTTLESLEEYFYTAFQTMPQEDFDTIQEEGFKYF